MLELQMPGVRRVTKLEVSSLYSPPPCLRTDEVTTWADPSELCKWKTFAVELCGLSFLLFGCEMRSDQGLWQRHP